MVQKLATMDSAHIFTVLWICAIAVIAMILPEMGSHSLRLDPSQVSIRTEPATVNKTDSLTSDGRVTNKQELCPLQCSCRFQGMLADVDCSRTGLQSLPLDLPYSTTILLFSQNELTSLDGKQPNLKNLELLILNQNKITSVDRHWFASLQKLEVLDLSSNLLQGSLPNNGFSTLTKLATLNLSRNEVTEILSFSFFGLEELKILDISNNYIFKIDDHSFHHLNSLVQLDMHGNNLVTLKHTWFQNLERLEKLDISLNKLQTLSNMVFWPLKALKQLWLNDNAISIVGLLSFKGLGQVTYLNLSANNITMLQEGTLRHVGNLKSFDISSNPLAILDKAFTSCFHLETLRLVQLYSLSKITSLSFLGLNNLRILNMSYCQSLSSIDRTAFHPLPKLSILDLRNNNLSTLASHVLDPLENLIDLHLQGNPWKCDCHLHWLLLWLSSQLTTHLPNSFHTLCDSPTPLKGHAILDALNHKMLCTNATIRHHTQNSSAHFRAGSNVILQCLAEGVPTPSVTWITPQNVIFHWNSLVTNLSDPLNYNQSLPSSSHLIAHDHKLQVLPLHVVEHFQLLHNGDLSITNVQRGDAGYYRCVASNPLSNCSVTIHLTLNFEFLVHIKIISYLVGLATSFAFLLATLIGVLIHVILRKCGIECPCGSGETSPKTQQLKKMLENMEHYKRQQLERLRDNYTSQVQRIKDNCMQQMERLRESYSIQIEKLRDFRDYGTQQIDRIRDNYYFQVQRVRDYSAVQIDRLRENYILQRTKIRKFSAHQLVRLRENYKLQQQHLNKILENLNLENCRNVCARTDSIIFEPEIAVDPMFVPSMALSHVPPNIVTLDSTDTYSQISAYFTPDENVSEVSCPEDIGSLPSVITDAEVRVDVATEHCKEHGMQETPIMGDDSLECFPEVHAASVMPDQSTTQETQV